MFLFFLGFIAGVFFLAYTASSEANDKGSYQIWFGENGKVYGREKS